MEAAKLKKNTYRKALNLILTTVLSLGFVLGANPTQVYATRTTTRSVNQIKKDADAVNKILLDIRYKQVSEMFQ